MDVLGCSACLWEARYVFLVLCFVLFFSFVGGWMITAERLRAVRGGRVKHARSFSVLVGMFCCFL